ncbi:hypothetical protein C5097_24730 (plasmid) [Escherichia coli]|nr:hypothetical protein C5097_24730 [Escherichia coli]
MHPVLGTMMPEICEAPHLPVFPFIYHCAPYLMGWDVFITFPVSDVFSPHHLVCNQRAMISYHRMKRREPTPSSKVITFVNSYSPLLHLSRQH